MLANGTIIDIYRKAQYFAKEPAVNKNGIQQAVNVARLMHPLPDISLTETGTARLTWKKDNVTLSMEFFSFNVNVVLSVKGASDQIFTGVQYHNGTIPVNILFVLLQQFCFMSNTPAPQINPWDEFSEVYFEDIDIESIKEREEMATQEKVKTFLSFKKIPDIKEDDTAAEQKDNVITKEEDINQEDTE